MSEEQNNILWAYNANCLEQHSNSSDFDYPQKLPKVQVKYSRQCEKILKSETEDLLKNDTSRGIQSCTKEFYKNHLLPLNGMCDVSTDVFEIDKDVRRLFRRLFRQNCQSMCKDRIMNFNVDNGTDAPSVAKLKKPVIFNKVLPCLSRVFVRSHNNFRHMVAVKENSYKKPLVDSSCQVYCAKCEHRQLRKFNRRKQKNKLFINNTYEPITSSYEQTNFNTIYNPNAFRFKNSHYCNSTTSSECESVKYRKNKKLRNFLEKRMNKEYFTQRIENAHMKNQEQQWVKQDYMKPQNVYANKTYISSVEDVDTEFDGSSNFSSSFFNYCLRTKNKGQKLDTVTRCDPNNCLDYTHTISKSTQENDVYRDTKNLGSPAKYLRLKCSRCNREYFEELKNGAVDVDTAQIKDQPHKDCSRETRIDGQQKDFCQCTMKNYPSCQPSIKPSNQPPGMLQPSSNNTKCSSGKSCQESHETIMKQLENQYNGRVLCIHNPPCVLINGCLKLPQTQANSFDFWTGTEEKSIYFLEENRLKNKNTEQASQYSPYIEFQQCTVRRTTDKNVQCTRYHARDTAPCEVKGSCYNAKCDAVVDNTGSFEINSFDNNNLEESFEYMNKYKGSGTPLSNNNYIVLTAKESVCTQVMPMSKYVCRHLPQCITIPKCLGKTIYNDAISLETLPGCVHRPRCDMIPACYRKSPKEMVTVHSQYPSVPCRIV